MAHATNDIQVVEMTAERGTDPGGLLHRRDPGALHHVQPVLLAADLLSLLPLPVMAFFMNRFGTQIYKEFKAAQGAFSGSTTRPRRPSPGCGCSSPMRWSPSRIKASPS